MYPACCQTERRAELYHSHWLLGRFVDPALSVAPLSRTVSVPVPSKLNKETGVKLRTLLAWVQAAPVCLRVLVVIPLASSPWSVSWPPTLLQTPLCSQWLMYLQRQFGCATCTERILLYPNFQIFGAVQGLSRSKSFSIEKIPLINILWKALPNCTFSH